MNAQTDSRSEQARQFYDAAATASTDFAFMNYGFAPLSAELANSAEPEKYCLQLYRQLLGGADLRGKKVVEVSCGRGGGAAHVAATYQPASYLGIDISERNLGLATQRFSGVSTLTFQQGNAEALPLPDGELRCAAQRRSLPPVRQPRAFLRRRRSACFARAASFSTWTSRGRTRILPA